MSKYSSSLKLEIVKYCIDEHHSSYDAAKKYNFPSPTPIKQWIRKYKKHGSEGLIKQFKSSYSGEFKENVIRYMLSDGNQIDLLFYNIELSCLVAFELKLGEFKAEYLGKMNLYNLMVPEKQMRLE